MNPDELFRLVYVEKQWAWFTDQPISEVWGDDWDDAPHFCNAGIPYEKTLGQYVKVAFDGPYEVVGTGFEDDRLGMGDGWFSVEQFNAKEKPWLWVVEYGREPVENRKQIWADTSLAEFRRQIEAQGGMVYTRVEPAPRDRT